MSILSKYVAKIFLRQWFICLSSVVCLSLVSSLFWNLSELVKGWTHFLNFWRVWGAEMPRILQFSWPIITIIAFSFTYNTLRNSGELVAIQTVGLSTVKIFSLVWGLVLGIAGLGYVNQTHLWQWVAIHQPAPLSQLEQSEKRWKILNQHIIYSGALTDESHLDNLTIFSWFNDKSALKAIHYLDRFAFNEKTLPQPLALGTKSDLSGIESKQPLKPLKGIAYQLHGENWRIEEEAKTLPLSLKQLIQILVPKQKLSEHAPLFILYQQLKSNILSPEQYRLYNLSFQQIIARFVGLLALVWFALLMLDIPGGIRGQPALTMVGVILGGLVYVIFVEVCDILGKGLILPVLWSAWSPIALLGMMIFSRWAYLRWRIA